MSAAAPSGTWTLSRIDVDEAGEVALDERPVRLGVSGRQPDVLVEQECGRARRNVKLPPAQWLRRARRRRRVASCRSPGRAPRRASTTRAARWHRRRTLRRPQRRVGSRPPRRRLRLRAALLRIEHDATVDHRRDHVMVLVEHHDVGGEARQPGDPMSDRSRQPCRCGRRRQRCFGQRRIR